MKKYLFIFILMLVIPTLHAQRGGRAPLDKGQVQLNFGNGVDLHGLPVYFSVDIALHKDVTLTPEVHMRLPYYDHPFSGGTMMKADYHWNYLIGIPPNFDFYSGARLGINFGDDIYPDFGIQTGGRWYWNDKWGLNLELALGNGFGITFGFSVKLD